MATGWDSMGTAVALLVAPALGSFALTVADRLAAGGSALAGRSRCEGCGAGLAWRDLVPFAGFALAGGRARCCGAALRPALPLAEAAALGVALWAVVAVPAPMLWPTLLLGWVLLGLALCDLACHRLPDPGTLGLALAGLALAGAGLLGPPLGHALGAALGFLLLAGAGALYRRLRGRSGLGLGDAKLLAAAGAWTGAAALPSVLLVAALAGLAQALVAARLAGGGLSGRMAVPWGPGLALGFWVTWLHGPLVLG